MRNELDKLDGFRVLCGEPLAGYTTWGIGGPAEILAFPRSMEDVQLLCGYAVKNGLKLNILGGGSNVLVRDEGVAGLLLCIKDGLTGYEFRESYLAAQAGVSLARLVQAAAAQGLGGLETLAGIPSTLGGRYGAMPARGKVVSGNWWKRLPCGSKTGWLPCRAPVWISATVKPISCREA